VHLAHTGFWAGYRPLLGRARALTLTARDTVLWALVPQHALGRILTANPGWWRHLMELAEDNVETVSQALADLTLQDSQARAIAVLLRLAGSRIADRPDGGPVEVRISQSELAGMAVMSRNTLNRVVGELVEAGLVEVGYRSVIVLDAARLRELLED
jgi:CRP/FNR family transcriptional regulator, cyclic AMP receptor protein